MRSSTYDISEFILNRWSPRAMSGESIAHDELMKLFDAARWAPSSYNNQPWRFVYSMREDERWQTFFDFLVPFNQSWCKNAAALIVVCSMDNFEATGKPSRTHSYDTGAASVLLSLQGYIDGLVVHQMEGFDYDKARSALNIPAGVTVEAMIAVGKPGSKEDLSQELQEREVQSDRKLLDTFVFEGKFE